MIKLTLVLLVALFSGAPDSLEQKATDYFFDNIFPQNYADIKVIEFQNQTDTSCYWGTVHQCKNWDHKTSGQIMSAIAGKSVTVKPKKPGIKIKSIAKNSGRLKVLVYSSIKVADSYYVSITVHKKLHFVDYYFIKFDGDGNVTDCCKAGEVI